MPKAVAKLGDRVVATDTHLVVPAGCGPPIPVKVAYDGVLVRALSPDVFVEHRPAAVTGSVAVMSPGHVVTPHTFARPPSHEARIVLRGASVFANGKAVAVDGDVAETCNDPVDLPIGKVVASGTVHTG